MASNLHYKRAHNALFIVVILIIILFWIGHGLYFQNSLINYVFTYASDTAATTPSNYNYITSSNNNSIFNLIFVHIPKTGGTTIENFFMQNYNIFLWL